jgi:hypothetical protein
MVCGTYGLTSSELNNGCSISRNIIIQRECFSPYMMTVWFNYIYMERADFEFLERDTDINYFAFQKFI